MQIMFVMIAFALLYFLRLPGLLPKEYRRDLVVFTLLMFIAFMISLLAVIGVKFPYPTVELMKIFKAVFRMKI
jgi:hypothetical protein